MQESLCQDIYHIKREQLLSLNFLVFLALMVHTGSFQKDMLQLLVAPPPLVLHALLPPQQLPHVGPGARGALLEGGGPGEGELIITKQYSSFFLYKQ